MTPLSLFVTIALFAGVVQAVDPYVYCTNQHFNITGSATIGCNLYANSASVSWNITAGSTPMTVNIASLHFLSLMTESGDDLVTIVCDGSTVGRFSGSIIPKPTWLCHQSALITFTSDGSNTYSGFKIEVLLADNIQPLQSNQVMHRSVTQNGGMVNFYMPNQNFGENASFQVIVDAYQGLQQPTLFVRNDAPPSLSAYDYMNVTMPYGSSGKQIATINVPSPAAGTWFVGVYLFGTSAALEVTGSWTWSITQLSSNVKVTGNITPAVPVYYQFYASQGAATAVFQISRQIPGDYPIAYIGQGYIPGPSQYDYILDTTVSSYQSVTVPNPNPFGNPKGNPGTYVITIVTTGTTAGFIFLAS